MSRSRIIYDTRNTFREGGLNTLDTLNADFHVVTSHSSKKIFNVMLSLAGIKEEDLDAYSGEMPLREKVLDLLPWFDDVRDGSPNIIYLCIDKEEIKCDAASSYYGLERLEHLDLSTISKKALVDMIIYCADMPRKQCEENSDEYSDSDDIEDQSKEDDKPKIQEEDVKAYFIARKGKESVISDKQLDELSHRMISIIFDDIWWNDREYNSIEDVPMEALMKDNAEEDSRIEYLVELYCGRARNLEEE